MFLKKVQNRNNFRRIHDGYLPYLALYHISQTILFSSTGTDIHSFNRSEKVNIIFKLNFLQRYSIYTINTNKI